MSQSPSLTPENPEESAISSLLGAEMMTLHIRLAAPEHALTLSMPRPEWLALVSHFVRMPADERQRVGVSIREATATDPFPLDETPLTAKQQRTCDVFVNDCILLAALAETVGDRILLDTAVEAYKVVSGLPRLDRTKGILN